MQVRQIDDETRREIDAAFAAVSARARRWYGRGLKRKPEDLDLIQRMFDDGRVGLAYVHEVVELGLALGALLDKRGWQWVFVEEEGESKLGMLPASATGKIEPIAIDPIAMLLGPVEAGRPVEVRALYDAAIAKPAGR
jgi:hypothetical protein